MQNYEHLVYGSHKQGDSIVRSVLAASPGMGTEVKDEVVRLCENWGTAPPLGLEHPALMSFPLKASMPSLRGRLYAVIRVGRGMTPIFHAKVLTDQSYTTFLRNPYTFAQSVEWIDQWEPGIRLTREEATVDSSRALVTPPSGPEDMGLVDEALLKLLVEGKLHLPLERPGPASDRSLSLLIACLPEKDRKELRFASFSTHEANDYKLAAMAADNCQFAGWKRLMSAWIAGEYIEEIETYIAAIRTYLSKGDMSGVTRVTMRMSPRPGGPKTLGSSDKVAAPDGMHQEVPRPSAKPVPAAKPVPPRPAPPRSTPAPRPASSMRPNTAPVPRPASSMRPNPSPALAASRKAGPGPAGGFGSTGPGSVDSGVLRASKNPARRKTTSRPRKSRPRWPLLRVGALSLVLAAAVFTGMNWMDGKTLAESLQWANITDWKPLQNRTERAPTLLEVVDVGMVYDSQLKLVTGHGGLGLKPSEDKGRRKAMGGLQDQAAKPLQEQVRLFNKLAADGIQQGNRPDREIQRMGSLADQGWVLQNEINRLELAYYSLASAAYWQDVSSLDDDQVMARRDSLLAMGKRSLEDACEGLWTVDPREALAEARDNVDGMASLLDLFQAKKWSPAWEDQLTKAAELVSPRASTMTRAYRNSAFSLVRIKKAERKAANRNLPFRTEFTDGAWPSAEVAAALPTLRAQTRVFGSNQAPPVLDALLDLYVDLKNPASLAQKARTNEWVLDKIQNNGAYKFDPEAYVDFVGRIRYEATVASLAEGGEAGQVPQHLGSPEEAMMAAAFRDTMMVTRDPAIWQSLASAMDDKFLAAWAGYHGQRAGARLAKSQEAFDAAWAEALKSVGELQAQVKSGEDWSGAWQVVNTMSRSILKDHARELTADPVRSGRVEAVANLAAVLEEPLPFGIRSMTVRLEQDQLVGPIPVRVEVSILPGEVRYLSEPLPMGPSAPEGTGWVGTMALDWSGRLAADQTLKVRVVSEDGTREIVGIDVPALSAGGGPGVLSRPVSAEAGSVKLRMDPGYWSALRVPDLGVIF